MDSKKPKENRHISMVGIFVSILRHRKHNKNIYHNTQFDIIDKHRVLLYKIYRYMRYIKGYIGKYSSIDSSDDGLDIPSTTDTYSMTKKQITP